jgi:RNA polymerase-binding transcription factor DksA
MINSEQIKTIEQKLEGEKKELLKKIEEHSKTKNFGDEGHVEDFESEKADEVEEFSNDLSIAQAFKERLEEVENALNLIKEGRYGICENCGTTIPEKELLKQPTRTMCLDCAPQA